MSPVDNPLASSLTAEPRVEQTTGDQTREVAAQLYAAACKRRGAMMQGGFGFLHADAREPWLIAAELYGALQEIETICNESAGDCRRRMGTRVGNSLVTARNAIAKVESHS